jgi:hypothetical protein
MYLPAMAFAFLVSMASRSASEGNVGRVTSILFRSTGFLAAEDLPGSPVLDPNSPPMVDVAGPGRSSTRCSARRGGSLRASGHAAEVALAKPER